MKTTKLALILASAACVWGASKPDKPAPGTDAAITERVHHEVVMYSRYTIWDDIAYRVQDGQVDLVGVVSQPYKKDDIERLVRAIPGVANVNDEIRVLPLSPADDRLRMQIAAAIYRDPVFTRYAISPHPPIHIIVENGRVTLSGLVSTEMDKEIAGMRASTAGLSFGGVINNLQVENPPAHKS